MVIIKLKNNLGLDGNNNFRVYDFTNGSLNNELRKTNDTDIEYEWMNANHPASKIQSLDVSEGSSNQKLIFG